MPRNFSPVTVGISISVYWWCIPTQRMQFEHSIQKRQIATEGPFRRSIITTWLFCGWTLEKGKDDGLEGSRKVPFYAQCLFEYNRVIRLLCFLGCFKLFFYKVLGFLFVSLFSLVWLGLAWYGLVWFVFVLFSHYKKIKTEKYDSLVVYYFRSRLYFTYLLGRKQN